MQNDALQEAPAFVEFASIARLTRDMVVTEKLDGTNASVHVLDDGRVLAASRSRYITPEADNYGFARWVKENEDELRTGLGLGIHFGEWWGSGIQRRYGLSEKRFSLFNVARWTSDFNLGGGPNDERSTQCGEVRCCHVVPVLLRWTFDTARVDGILTLLGAHGSYAAPKFDKPEGVVVYHASSRQLFKKTLDKNDGHKSASPSPDRSL